MKFIGCLILLVLITACAAETPEPTIEENVVVSTEPEQVEQEAPEPPIESDPVPEPPVPEPPVPEPPVPDDLPDTMVLSSGQEKISLAASPSTFGVFPPSFGSGVVSFVVPEGTLAEASPSVSTRVYTIGNMGRTVRELTILEDETTVYLYDPTNTNKRMTINLIEDTSTPEVLSDELKKQYLADMQLPNEALSKRSFFNNREDQEDYRFKLPEDRYMPFDDGQQTVIRDGYWIDTDEYEFSERPVIEFVTVKHDDFNTVFQMVVEDLQPGEGDYNEGLVMMDIIFSLQFSNSPNCNEICNE